MEYRFLGKTGLKVSVISYGAYMLDGHFKKDAEEETYETVKRAYELGINFFDNAEGYDFGKSEVAMGKAFKRLGANREDLVISTKIFFGNGVLAPAQPNNKGVSRKRIVEGINNSLKRLQLDYVDVVFAHRYDPDTPLEEVCRGFHSIIEDNKAFYWGTSEWTAQQIVEAIELCERLNLHKPVVEQPQYSMIHRENFEVSYAEVFDKFKYGSTIWSPLAGGLLTGRYLEGDTAGRYGNMPETFKKLGYWEKYFSESKIEGTRKMFKELGEIAKELGGNIAQLALAWTLWNKDVSTAICGYSKVSQVEDNVKALEIYKKFTKEIDERIENIIKTRPDYGRNPKTWAPFPPRR